MTDDKPAPKRRFAALRNPLSRPRPLSCQELVELVTAYLDDALKPPTRKRFEQHLLKCDGCGAYLDELRDTIALLGTLQERDFDPIYRYRLMAAFAETAGSW